MRAGEDNASILSFSTTCNVFSSIFAKHERTPSLPSLAKTGQILLLYLAMFDSTQNSPTPTPPPSCDYPHSVLQLTVCSSANQATSAINCVRMNACEHVRVCVHVLYACTVFCEPVWFRVWLYTTTVLQVYRTGQEKLNFPSQDQQWDQMAVSLCKQCFILQIKLCFAPVWCRQFWFPVQCKYNFADANKALFYSCTVQMKFCLAPVQCL